MMPATIRTELNATGTAPIYACRAWVNFNGTGTPAIRASGNCSSLVDNGVGDYTINFTNAMIDANYSVAASGNISSYDRTFISIPITGFTYSNSSVRILANAYNGTSFISGDTQITNVTIFR